MFGRCRSAILVFTVLAHCGATAHAGVRIGIGIGVPVYPRPYYGYRGYYYRPYVVPGPVYLAPAPVYVVPGTAPVYVQPAPVAYPPATAPPPVYQGPAPTPVYQTPAPAVPVNQSPGLPPQPVPVGNQ